MGLVTYPLTYLASRSDTACQASSPTVVWVSWGTYPAIYLFPTLDPYCVADIIAKCGMGLVTYPFHVLGSLIRYGCGVRLDSWVQVVTCDYENTNVPLSVELCGAEIMWSPLAQGFNIEITTLLRTIFLMRSCDRLVWVGHPWHRGSISLLSSVVRQSWPGLWSTAGILGAGCDLRLREHQRPAVLSLRRKQRQRHGRALWRRDQEVTPGTGVQYRDSDATEDNVLDAIVGSSRADSSAV